MGNVEENQFLQAKKGALLGLLEIWGNEPGMIVMIYSQRSGKGHLFSRIWRASKIFWAFMEQGVGI